MKAIRHITDPNLIAMGHLVRLLTDNTTLDNRQLAEQTGLNYLTVCRYTAVFHQVGAAYVRRWKQDPRGAQTIRIFCLGEGVDAKPVVETQAQKMKRLRRKWKVERNGNSTRFTHEGDQDDTRRSQSPGSALPGVLRQPDRPMANSAHWPLRQNRVPEHDN